jgi:hypothetical protein
MEETESTRIERILRLEFNFFQTIAATGVAVSLAADIGLRLMGKHMPNFWALYVVWAAVFIGATFIPVADVDDHHHHHGHDHDHDHDHEHDHDINSIEKGDGEKGGA